VKVVPVPFSEYSRGQQPTSSTQGEAYRRPVDPTKGSSQNIGIGSVVEANKAVDADISNRSCLAAPTYVLPSTEGNSERNKRTELSRLEITS
jgi:hypothetical protein